MRRWEIDFRAAIFWPELGSNRTHYHLRRGCVLAYPGEAASHSPRMVHLHHEITPSGVAVNLALLERTWLILVICREAMIVTASNHHHLCAERGKKSSVHLPQLNTLCLAHVLRPKPCILSPASFYTAIYHTEQRFSNLGTIVSFPV